MTQADDKQRPGGAAASSPAPAMINPDARAIGKATSHVSYVPVKYVAPDANRPLRALRFAATDAKSAHAWQESSRTLLLGLLNLADLVQQDQAPNAGIAFNVQILKTTSEDKFTRYDLVLNSTPGRRILAALTVPEGKGPFPAVVCIHGHSADRRALYDRNYPYPYGPHDIYAYGAELAARGYVTIGVDVAQHVVCEKGRTLIGERLWDLMRCVTYLTTRPEVDAKRIGCAGISLGGEMAMWLGAMDTRVVATVASGALTTVEHMRADSCACWNFPGLQESFDFADIYCLIAPRPLQCQNGMKETPDGFPVSLAQKAFAEIEPCYKALGAANNVQFVAHGGGHVFDLASGVAFLDSHLKTQGK